MNKLDSPPRSHTPRSSEPSRPTELHVLDAPGWTRLVHLSQARKRILKILIRPEARQGKLTQAEETHRRATQCPDGWVDEAYHNLGLVLRGQGRLSEAADCFRKAIELDPEYANAIEALQDVEAAMALSAGVAESSVAADSARDIASPES